MIEKLLLSALVIASAASDVAQRRHLLVEHVVVGFQFALHPAAVHVLGVCHQQINCSSSITRCNQDYIDSS